MEQPFAEWSEFNVAVAGAGAALGGLLIVALSVNIREIVSSRSLAARAGASIAGLILGVVLCCAALIPGQVDWGYGIQVLVGSAILIALIVAAGRAVVQDAVATGTTRYARANIIQFCVPAPFFVVGGLLLMLGLEAGLVVAAVGTILALIGAVVFSWVALVEILR